MPAMTAPRSEPPAAPAPGWTPGSFLVALARLMARRVREDGCLEVAGSLAFVTALALVPAAAVVLAILGLVPAFAPWTDEVVDFLFRSFVPAGGEVIKQHVVDLAARASRLGALGLILLTVSVLVAMSTVEAKINDIWRIRRRRPLIQRLLVYWAMLSLGPLLLLGGLAATSYLVSLALDDRTVHLWTGLVLRALPWITSFLLFLMLYAVVPARRVPLSRAGLAAALAASAFEITKHFFAVAIVEYSSYPTLYGTLALLPVLLIWIWLSWVVTLIGAELASCLTVLAAGPPVTRERAPLAQALSVLESLRASQRAGRPADENALRHAAASADPDPVLEGLERAGLVLRVEGGGLCLARPLEEITAREVVVAVDRQLAALFGETQDNRDRPAGRLAAELERALEMPVAALVGEGDPDGAETAAGLPPAPAARETR